MSNAYDFFYTERGRDRNPGPVDRRAKGGFYDDFLGTSLGSWWGITIGSPGPSVADSILTVVPTTVAEPNAAGTAVPNHIGLPNWKVHNNAIIETSVYVNAGSAQTGCMGLGLFAADNTCKIFCGLRDGTSTYTRAYPTLYGAGLAYQPTYASSWTTTLKIIKAGNSYSGYYGTTFIATITETTPIAYVGIVSSMVGSTFLLSARFYWIRIS